MKSRCATLWAAALLFVLPSTLAQAWDVKVDEDPMSDKKVAFINSPSSGSSAFNYQVLAFKCWEGDPQETLVIFTTSETWDNSAEYATVIPVKIRVDKNEPLSVLMVPSNLGGNFSATIPAGLDPQVFDIIRQIRTAKKHVAMEIGTVVLKFPATRSQKSVDTFTATCRIDLSKPLASDGKEEETSPSPDSQ